MASNSFLLKGWMISLASILLAIIKDICSTHFLLIILLPIISFWYLDAYFLRIERMYRKLYEWIICHRLSIIDFTYDLNPHRFKKDVPCEIKIMFSQTLLIFYGIPSLVLIVTFVTNQNGWLS